MAGPNNPGEKKAWEILSTLDPDEVCKAASAFYDRATGKYVVTSLGMRFDVSPKERPISSASPGSEVILHKLGYFFKLSILWYLVSAKDIRCTERLVKLQNIKGGDIFTRGSHLLPLDRLALKYGANKSGFIEKGKTLAGEIMKYGDASLKLFPFPRVPVVLTLWLEDEEFPARADLLFDSTCDLQLPVDIIWSTAMLTVLAML